MEVLGEGEPPLKRGGNLGRICIKVPGNNYNYNEGQILLLELGVG